MTGLGEYWRPVKRSFRGYEMVYGRVNNQETLLAELGEMKVFYMLPLLVEIGGPLIKFLPYIAKTQLLLPRGKNKVKILSQRKDDKIQNNDRHFPLNFSSHRKITNTILCYFCRCDAKILLY